VRRPAQETPGGRAVPGLAAVTVSVALAPFLIGALAPRIAEDFVLTTRDVGAAMAGYYVVSGLLSPVGGRVVERLGTTRTLRLACALSSVGLLLIARAESATQTIAVLTFLGLPNAMVQPACNDVLARVEHPRVRALSFGVLQASIPTATLLAALVLGLASSLGGWRGTTAAVAVLSVFAQLLVPKVAPRHRISSVASHGSASRPARATAPAAYGGWLFLGGLTLTGFLASSALTTLPSFAATTGHHYGLTAWTIATAQTVGSLGSAATRIVVASAASHSTMRTRLVVVATLQGIGVLGFLALASGTTVGFVLGTIVAFSFGWGFNGLFNMIVTSARPRDIARSTGLTQGGIFLGGMAGPLVFAAVAGTSHFRSGWAVMALFMAAATLTTLLAHRTARGGAPQPALDPATTNEGSSCR
jgi:MFS family permease